MCGFTGFVGESLGKEVAICLAGQMAKPMAHRGPDDSGIWAEENGSVALAFRRLSILDLSPAGYQPMVSLTGRYVVVFNGEIYNYRDLREELEDGSRWSVAGGQGTEDGCRKMEGVEWRGHSDTEVLLAGIEQWGMEKTLKKTNGMFALALWDRQKKMLTLARDRLGEKPLYYGRCGSSFVFASELRALRTHPEWRGEINRDVLALYLRHGYVPDPYSIYQEIQKVPPAHWVEVVQGQAGKPRPYWELERVVAKNRSTETEAELVDQLQERLRRAVRLRMEADVPLGAFLSGGIDSSTVVSLMQEQSTRRVKTFTIGFEVPGYDEAVYAKEVARHLGTDHTELYLSPRDALATVPELPRIWDEPFADSSQIPTYLLSRMTRNHVKVALSGDGGDELFAGYNRYGLGYGLHRCLRRMPGGMIKAAAWLLQVLPSVPIDRLIAKMPRGLRYPAAGDRLKKLGLVLSQKEGRAFYRALVSLIPRPADFLREGREAPTLLERPEEWPKFEDFRETMMYLDTKTYLPGDILTKVDRASMAVSLEARVPLLDHHLVEFAWSLPIGMKVGRGQTKRSLRQVLRRYLPENLISRPKMGFAIPIEQWLTGPLRSWAEDLLCEETIRKSGFLDPRTIRQIWREHQDGARRHHYQIWNILMFQAWLRENQKPLGPLAESVPLEAAGIWR